MTWLVVFSYFAVYGLLYPRYGRDTWRVVAPTAIASSDYACAAGQRRRGSAVVPCARTNAATGHWHRLRDFLQEHFGRRDAIAWLSVALSAINTLLSFGLLSLSKTPALQAFGLTMLIGTVAVCLVVPCFTVAARDNEIPTERLGVTV